MDFGISRSHKQWAASIPKGDILAFCMLPGRGDEKDAKGHGRADRYQFPGFDGMKVIGTPEQIAELKAATRVNGFEQGSLAAC
jgi:hypothetical protein